MYWVVNYQNISLKEGYLVGTYKGWQIPRFSFLQTAARGTILALRSQHRKAEVFAELQNKMQES